MTAFGSPVFAQSSEDRIAKLEAQLAELGQQLNELRNEVAAPISDLGVQLRGVQPVGDRSRFTYAAYVGNGLKIEAEDGEIHAVEAEGLASDPDDELVRNIVNGLATPGAALTMPAKGGNPALTDDDVRAVLAYIREAYGS
jgi:hypothetical protein